MWVSFNREWKDSYRFRRFTWCVHADFIVLYKLCALPNDISGLLKPAKVPFFLSQSSKHLVMYIFRDIYRRQQSSTVLVRISKASLNRPSIEGTTLLSLFKLSSFSLNFPFPFLSEHFYVFLNPPSFFPLWPLLDSSPQSTPGRSAKAPMLGVYSDTLGPKRKMHIWTQQGNTTM